MEPAFFASPAASLWAGKACLRPGVPEPCQTLSGQRRGPRPTARGDRTGDSPLTLPRSGRRPHREAASDRLPQTGLADSSSAALARTRPPLMVALERHLLGDGEVVLLGPVPVDGVDGLRHLARLDLHGHAVAQQVVDGLVVPVERAAVAVRLSTELVEGDADLRGPIAALGQPCGEQALLDVVVAVAVGPVAEVAVAQLVAEQGDDAVLSGAFGLADGADTSRILPVSSSCIMPCLRARVLARLSSSAAISASMSESTAARADCSGSGGSATSIPLRI